MQVSIRNDGTKRVLVGDPSGGRHSPGALGLPGSASGGAVPGPHTWGDECRRRLRLEPCTQTRKRYPDNSDSPIDGELYTQDCRRGNIRAVVVGTGETIKLHPFTGASKGAGPANALPVRVYEGRRLSTGEAPEPTTLVTARTPNDVVA